MKNVYVIVSGCIDDRHVYGIYSTQEKAQNAINKMNDIDKMDADIEKFKMQ